MQLFAVCEIALEKKKIDYVKKWFHYCGQSARMENNVELVNLENDDEKINIHIKKKLVEPEFYVRISF